MANIKSTIYRRTSSCSSYTSSSGTSDDDDDDGKPLKPIRDYIPNRKDLARELFRSVKAEKIRMMLPQTLKKVDLKELEEWCASELSGMSKSRILAILASTNMPQSSATSESDDSGPSLEIISDTEAWISDSEQQTIKQEGQSLAKTSRNKSKRNRKSKETTGEDKTIQLKPGSIKSNDSSLTGIKREETVKEVKPQEGESLLDLLELEMRARAIRALIRKEEDIIPNVDGEKSAVGSALKQTLNSIALHEKNVNDKENNGRKEVESKLVNIGEDEDLVLVVKPTPTISLLSSDGESDDNSGERTKKVLGNEHRTENKVLTTDERRVHVREKSSINPDTLEIVVTTQPRETNREKSVTCEKPVITAQLENLQNNQIKLADEKPVKKITSSKKTKKKHTTKLPKASIDLKAKSEIEESKLPSTSEESKEPPVKKAIKVVHEETMLDKVVMIKKSSPPGQDPDKAAETVNNKPTLLTDNDYEEIIDLDAYPDDMDDMEMDENMSTPEKTVKKLEDSEIKAASSTETWASRYYQTDSVQNVIKDSKIQSEIRKRLRERQKLSKLNSLKSIAVEPQKADVIETKPTGSVEEYLALKAIADTSIPEDKNNSEDKQEVESSGEAAAAVQLGQDDSDNTDNQIKDIERRAEGDREASSVVASVEIPQVIA